MDIKCPHCGTEYEIDKSEYGRYVKCEVCGKGFVAGTSSASKKLGEAASAATDALKIAANTAYERINNIDWKARQERAKSAIGSAYEKGKEFWRSAKGVFEERQFFRMLSRWWYALKVAIKALVDNHKGRKMRIVGALTVVCLLLFLLMIFVPVYDETAVGLLQEDSYESSELSYDMAPVNQMECAIEKGMVNELDLDCVPYDVRAAILFSLDNRDGNAPTFGTAYKYNDDGVNTLTLRISDVYSKGVLVRVEQAMYSNRLEYTGVKRIDKWAFIRTDRYYEIGEELHSGYYILCGGAQCKLRVKNSDRHRVLKVLAFREMDEDIVAMRGLANKADK